MTHRRMRRDTKAAWQEKNTADLQTGEWAYELDTGRFKIGRGVSDKEADGVRTYAQLDYAVDEPPNLTQLQRQRKLSRYLHGLASL